MSVSLCMIVRNEAANLPAAITSAKDIVDDLVIVDTGSNDGTPELAARLGARVYDFPWRDDFAAARNESVRHARGDWILWLDGDDRIPPPSQQLMRELFQMLDPRAACAMKVVSIGPDGRPAQHAEQVRLFPNRPDVRWEYRVHEQVSPSLRRAGCEVRFVEPFIVHVGYVQGAAVQAKLDRNLRLIDLGLEDSPLDGHLLSCRALTLISLGRGAEALVSLGLWEAAHPRNRLTPTLRAAKATAFALERDLCGALECVREGLRDYPGNTKLTYYEANILAALGDFEASEQALRAELLLREQHGTWEVVDPTIDQFRAPCLLADVLLSSGNRVDEAVAIARRIVVERPGYGYAWLTLAEAALRLGDEALFEGICDTLGAKADAEAVVALSMLRALRLYAQGDIKGADASLREGPTDHPVTCAMLAKFAARLGRRDEAIRAAEVALGADPLNLTAWAALRDVHALGGSNTEELRCGSRWF